MKRGRYQSAPKPICKTILLPCLLVMILIGGCIIWLSTARNTPLETQPVEKLENSTAIPGFEALTLKADTKKQNIVLSNPPQNTCLFRISLILEDGTLLWTSREIKPGKDSDPIKLSQPLDAGQYPNAMLKYECFAMDGKKTPLNGAEIKLTLRVKN